MDYDPNTGFGPAAIVALVVGYVLFVLIVVAVAYVLQAIGLMQLFKKVGIEPWIAWVPYYNTWKLLEVGSQPGWMILLTLVPGGSIVLLVFLIFTYHRVGISFGKGSEWVVLGVFLPWLWGILLGRPQEVYDPRRLQAYGYPPPNAGYGSVPPGPGL